MASNKISPLNLDSPLRHTAPENSVGADAGGVRVVLGPG